MKTRQLITLAALIATLSVTGCATTGLTIPAPPAVDYEQAP